MFTKKIFTDVFTGSMFKDVFTYGEINESSVEIIRLFCVNDLPRNPQARYFWMDDKIWNDSKYWID